MLSTIFLIAVAVGFAWNLGVHYTGAVMGMPYASNANRHVAGAGQPGACASSATGWSSRTGTTVSCGG